MYDATSLRAGLRDLLDAQANLRTPWRPTSDEYVSGSAFGSRPPIALGIIDAEVAAHRALKCLYRDTVADLPRFLQYPPHGYRGAHPDPLIPAPATQGQGSVRRPPRTLVELVSWCNRYAEFVVESTTETQLEYLLGQLLPAMQTMAGFTTTIDKTMGVLTQEVHTRRQQGMDPDVYLSAQRCAKLSPVTVNRRTLARWAEHGYVKSRVGSDGQRELSVVDVVTRCGTLSERAKSVDKLNDQEVGDFNG